MLLVGDFGSSYCKEEDGLAISDLFPRVSIFSSISPTPGEGKKRNPDNIPTSSIIMGTHF